MLNEVLRSYGIRLRYNPGKSNPETLEDERGKSDPYESSDPADGVRLHKRGPLEIFRKARSGKEKLTRPREREKRIRLEVRGENLAAASSGSKARGYNPYDYSGKR